MNSKTTFQKTFLTVILVWGFTIQLLSQISLQWMTPYSNGIEGAVHTSVGIGYDNSGNVYTAGSVENGNDFDFVTLKYNSSGIFQWSVNYDAGNNEEAREMVADGNGNVIVSGVDTDDQEIILIKYNASGAEEWNVRYPSSQDEIELTDMFVDASGNIYISGIEDDGSKHTGLVLKYDDSGNLLWVRTIINFDLTITSVGTDNSGNVYAGGYFTKGSVVNAILIKYNPAGTFQWKLDYSGGLPLYINSMEIDGSGSVYLAGSVLDGSDFDIHIVKVNPDASIAWSMNYDYVNTDDFLNITQNQDALSHDASDNIVLAGIATDNSSSFSKTIVAKIDPNGNLVWENEYNTFTFNYSNGIYVHSNGNIWVTGSFLNGSDSDVLLLEFDSNGNLLQTKEQSLDTDAGFYVIADNSGNVYVAGRSTPSEGNYFALITIKYSQEIISNLPPALSTPFNVDICENGIPQSVSITVTDEDVNSVTLSGSSDNQTLVPDANIAFGGNGANRTVTITPAAGQSGSANITVTATDNGNLTSSVTFNITVNPAPSVNAGADVVVYNGYSSLQCATLNASANGGTPAYAYSWSSGENTSSINACPTSASTYVVTVSDSKGCTAADEVKVCVMDVRCSKGGNAMVKGSGDKVMVCHIPPGNPENKHTICVSENAVQAHLDHGDVLGACGATASCGALSRTAKTSLTVVYDPGFMVEVSPNPAVDQAYLTIIPETSGKISVSVLTISGQETLVLMEKDMEEFDEVQLPLNTSILAPGTYFIKVSSSSGYSMTQKFVVAH